MHIDRRTGLVTRAEMAPSTGHAILDNAALSAVRRWRFKPGTVAQVRLPITFSVPTTIDPNRWYPFSGIVRSINVRASTITVKGPEATDTILVNARTQLLKNGRRISLEEVDVGDSVRGRATIRLPTFTAIAKSVTIKSASE